MNGKRQQKIVPLIALDTNVFIYYYQTHREFITSANKIFIELEKKRSRAITSIITLIELLSFKGAQKEIEKLHDAFVSTPNLTVIAIADDVALDSARIRREYGYKTSDAIQLATALYAKADLFITNDKRLQNFKEIKIKMLQTM